MEPVRLVEHQVLFRRNEPAEFVDFLENGLVALFIRFSDGFQVEVGLIGSEGMVGLSAFSGVPTEATEAVVQVPGQALRMRASEFSLELRASPELDAIMRRYSESVWADALQLAACNGHHSLERRLARWLLMVQDRTGRRELRFTHETLATMLCVHRPSVTVAAGRLQRAGGIRYSGGTMIIESRFALEHAACECYGMRKQRIARG